jgi:putative molybdopterin biosynthesis protein
MRVMELPESEWLSVQQARGLLDVSRLTLLRLIDAGDLPAYRIGRRIRLRAADVEAYRRRRQGE